WPSGTPRRRKRPRRQRQPGPPRPGSPSPRPPPSPRRRPRRAKRRPGAPEPARQLMLIGEVVGRLWASRQAEGLAGRKLLLVRPIALSGHGARLTDGRGLVV